MIAKVRFLCVIALLISSIGCTPPTPHYCCLRDHHADYDLCMIEHNVPTPVEKLTLCDVLQIALDRNLDIQMQQLEDCLQNKTYIAEKLRQLQHLRLDGELSDRNKPRAYLQQSLDTGALPDPTVSSEKERRVFNITPAFNILDFGLTYIKAQQEKNRVYLLRQRHLRAKQNLILDVYRAYYRVVVAKKAKEKAGQLITQLEERQSVLQREVEQQIVSEMKGLLNENRLIDMQIQLAAFENEYRSGMTELAALMGYRPGQPFEIVDVVPDDINVTLGNLECLDHVALRLRPELMAQDMQYYIDADEVHAAMVRLFPNLEAFLSWQYDGDIFQVFRQWTTIGATVAYDLFQIPSKIVDRQAAKYQRDISWNKRLSMSMGVLTQVHLAAINVKESISQYHLAQELEKVKTRQYEVSLLFEARQQLDPDDILAFEVEALYSQVNALRAYSNVQLALEQLGNSIGKPLAFSTSQQACYLPYIESCCAYDLDCDLGIVVDHVHHVADAGENFYYEEYTAQSSEETTDLPDEEKEALRQWRKLILNRLAKKLGSDRPAVLQSRQRIMDVMAKNDPSINSKKKINYQPGPEKVRQLLLNQPDTFYPAQQIAEAKPTTKRKSLTPVELRQRLEHVKSKS